MKLDFNITTSVSTFNYLQNIIENCTSLIAHRTSKQGRVYSGMAFVDAGLNRVVYTFEKVRHGFWSVQVNHYSRNSEKVHNFTNEHPRLDTRVYIETAKGQKVFQQFLDSHQHVALSTAC